MTETETKIKCENCNEVVDTDEDEDVYKCCDCQKYFCCDMKLWIEGGELVCNRCHEYNALCADLPPKKNTTKHKNRN